MRLKYRLRGSVAFIVCVGSCKLAGCAPDFESLRAGSSGSSGSWSDSGGSRAMGGTGSEVRAGSGGEPAMSGRAGAPGGASGTAGMGGNAALPEVDSAGAGGAEDGSSGSSAGGVGGAGGDAAVDDPGGAPGLPPDSPIEIVETIPIAKTWSGHPVDYALLTRDDYQFVAFYNGSQNMMIASRRLDEETWVTQALPSTASWDSHQGMRLAADEEGYLHLVGNMHNSALVYFRTTAPLDITTFKRQFQMLGTEESSCTYPELFHGPEGSLIFTYRNGSSGSADHIFNIYDVGTQSWSRLLTTPLLSGEGARNAYPVGPVQGPDGYWHIVWVWRDNSNAETNHDLSYARSRDLLNWEKADGTPLELPITLSTGDIVDPVPAGGGMINNNTKVGFDAENRAVVSYHKFDENNLTQLYNARFEDGAWTTRAATNWDYMWAFGGGGTIEFEILVEPVVPDANGSLIQRYFHHRYDGWGAFLLDPHTLQAVEEVEPPLPYPRALDRPESDVAEMRVRWAKDTGAARDAGVYYMLRWETLDSNRDEPRATVPQPTELRLYAFRAKRD